MTKIAPSLIAADAACLAEEVRAVAAAGADLLHMDIMDGAFVPNITFGSWIHKAIHNVSTIPLDTHLMVADPDRYLDVFYDAGASYLTVHVEACTHIHRSLAKIRDLGAKAGLALNPGTPLEAAEPLLESLDLLLIMSVNPGFAGQAFIPQAINRVTRAAQWRKERGLNFVIEVDGGVGPANAKALRDAGADILVAGNSVYKTNDYAAAIASLRS